MQLCMYPNQQGSFVFHINTKLDTSRVFSQIGPPRRVHVWPCCERIGDKCLSKGHNDAMPS